MDNQDSIIGNASLGLAEYRGSESESDTEALNTVNENNYSDAPGLSEMVLKNNGPLPHSADFDDGDDAVDREDSESDDSACSDSDSDSRCGRDGEHGREAARSLLQKFNNRGSGPENVHMGASRFKEEGETDHLVEVSGYKTLREQLEISQKERALTHKQLLKMPVDARKRHLEMEAQKERGFFLMPDAPPKRSRKTSPERVPCPLSEGTPQTPPARVLMSWEVQSAGSSITFDPPPASPPAPSPQTESSSPATPAPQTLFLSSSEITTISEEDNSELTILPMEVDMEFIDFSTASSVVNTLEANLPSSSMQNPRPDSPDPLELVKEEDVFSWVEQADGSDYEEEDAAPVGQVDTSVNLAEELAALEAWDDQILRRTAEDAGGNVTSFDWRQDASTFVGTKEPFNGPSGPTFPMNDETPLSVFERIFDQELIELMVRETNRYAHQLLAYPRPKDSRMTRWTDTNNEEMWVFLSILIVQGLASFSVEKEYWSPNLWFLKLTHFGKIMSHNRFALLKKCLHFVDNRQSVGITSESKRHFKIAPVVELLNRRFAALYLPGQEIALDDSLLLWKGRLGFAQLIANKTAKVGIKSYELCESKTGYLWSVRLYAGKCTDSTTDDLPDKPCGSASKVVFELMRPLLGRGHVLVMDNFFNSPLLSRLLKRQRTDTMGTLRLNREFVPHSLKFGKSQLRPGEVAFSQTRDITIIAWRDTNLVGMISTFHPIAVSGKEKLGRYGYKPEVVLDYNMAMGGVDKKDQLLSAFPIERSRNAVWYKKVFRRLLNVSIMNAHIIFTTQTAMTARCFRQTLVENILAKYKAEFGPSTTVTVAPKNALEMRFVIGGHYLEKSENKSSRCKWCSKQGVRRRTSFRCDTCLVPLCIMCFKNYHTVR